MLTDPGTVRLLARFLFLTLANRVRELLGDLAVRLRGGRGLKSGQRLFLLRDFRLELQTAVQDAESHAISDEEANRISLIRSLIRWLEGGELPGPDAILFLEKQPRARRTRPPLKTLAWTLVGHGMGHEAAHSPAKSDFAKTA
ncbi:MAG TPA: hypothetical protein VIJ21_08145 [Solirubrobacterales bacterium]